MGTWESEHGSVVLPPRGVVRLMTALNGGRGHRWHTGPRRWVIPSLWGAEPAGEVSLDLETDVLTWEVGWEKYAASEARSTRVGARTLAVLDGLTVWPAGTGGVIWRRNDERGYHHPFPVAVFGPLGHAEASAAGHSPNT